MNKQKMFARNDETKTKKILFYKCLGLHIIQKLEKKTNKQKM